MSTGCSISLTEDFVLLHQDQQASARLRRDARRASQSRSRSRGRPPGRAVSPLRDSGAMTPLAVTAAGPVASTSRTPTPRGRSPERPREASPLPEVEDSPPPVPTALVRGLLTVTLNKPSRIRKINLRFRGIARTDWPEGIGPRRIEISEDFAVFIKNYSLFSANAATPALRRSNSVETLDATHEERQSRRDQHIRQLRGSARAASVMPGREPSIDRLGGAYIAARDAMDQWHDAPPSFTEAAAPVMRLSTSTTSYNDDPSPSRPPTLEGQERLETRVADSQSPLPTSATDEDFDFEPELNGSSSAPVSSTARSSFEQLPAPLPEPQAAPTARPSYQAATSTQRSTPGKATTKENGAHPRFSLTSLLKNRDRSESKRREESPGPADRSRSRGRQMNLKAIRDALTSTVDSPADAADSDDDEEELPQHNWREFKAGRYVWPIQIPIPVTLPPSMSAAFGSIVYTLKAHVVRVGALTPNLTAETRVELVSSPGEDDTEETDSIVIERLWEYQMRYMITLSGKAFPVGGQIPISIRLNPMAKVKLYRIMASIEEKMSYYAHGRRIARHEGVKRFQLCRVEHELAEGEEPKPLLPVFSNDTRALLDSPLASWMINATANSEHVPRLLDPSGPWELETFLQLPSCKSRMHFSIKHPASVMESTHIFKLILRVERGDRDFLDVKGSPKKFDIVIECPIILLSCRNSTNILPPYSTAGAIAPTARSETCGCPASASEDALARQQHFARLVAGVESESGEVPPAYEASPTASPSRNPSHSPSSTTPERTASRGRRSSISNRLNRSLSRPS